MVPYRRCSTGGCEVFWVLRSESLRFMGGWNAFPGGGLSAGDQSLPQTGEFRGADSYRASGPPAAHAACALRELFEETGILPLAGASPPAAEIDRAREELLAGQLDFGAWLRRHGVALDASDLCYAGRWVTPPLSKIRFDATFFLLEWPDNRPGQPSVIPGELASGEWIAASDALAHWSAGRARLAQPTLETIRTLAVEGPGGADQLWKSQALKPDQAHAIEFLPLIRVIPVATRTLPPATHTNAMLVGGKDMVLIDPGTPWPSEVQDLCAVIDSESQRTGGTLREIWLSHHHDDHVAGAEEVRRRYAAPLRCHPSTARLLARQGIKIDGYIRDGEVIELDGQPRLRMRAIHTPGHASGHLCFLEERTRALLAGDMVSGFGTVVISPPDGSMTQYLESIHALLAWKPTVLLPSHGTMYRDAAKALSDVRQHRLRREERILELWRTGLRDPDRMVQAEYKDLPSRAKQFAIWQIVAHLKRLEDIGRIRSLPDRIRRLAILPADGSESDAAARSA